MAFFIFINFEIWQICIIFVKKITMNKLQTDIEKCFSQNFGYTPLNERIKDIQNQFFGLVKWGDIKDLKEKSGDLMASLIQLHSECGWSIDTNISDTINKINSRSDQYKSLGRKYKVAILGGAFNPITVGHIQLAQFALNSIGQFDEVWLMPAYSHMYNKKMVSTNQRIEMCELASKFDARIKVFDYEIKNKLSGETYYFFKKLHQEKDLMSKYEFSMIMGLDNANTFNKWVNYEELERIAKFVVVNRKGYARDDKVDWYLKPPHIYINAETDIMEISSTEIRNMLISKDDNVKNYLNPDVYQYIIDNNLYM